MNPQEYIEHTKKELKKRLIFNDEEMDEEIKNLTNELQNRVIGFRVDSWGHVKHIDSDFEETVTAELAPEIATFRKKVQNRIQTRIDKLTGYRYKQRIDDLIYQTADNILDEEIKTIQPKIKEIMREQINEHLGPWHAMIKMKESSS